LPSACIRTATLQFSTPLSPKEKGISANLTFHAAIALHF
jgi:hypothetical protein